MSFITGAFYPDASGVGFLSLGESNSIINRGNTMMKLVVRAAAAFSLALTATGCALTGGKTSEQVGKVEFKNSCSPAVQEKLLRGIATLHSFYYSATQKAFEEVAAEDNSCVIAAWGYADAVFASDYDIISDIGKARRFGFSDSLDTEEMLLRLLAGFRAERIVP